MDDERSRRPWRRTAPALLVTAAAGVLAATWLTGRSAAEPPAIPATAPAAPQPSDGFEIAAREPALPPRPVAPDAGVSEAIADAREADEDLIDCLIEPSQLVDIGSPVIGLIETIHVERSESVERDQVLVELESGAERAAVELARARSEMNGAELAREANLRLGGRKQARAQRLFEKSAISLDLREESETAAELARRELQQAREERRLASLQLDQAEELLRRRTIRSPVDGVVVERLMAPGERVDEEVILRIAQLDPLLVDVTLPAALFDSIQLDAKAAVEPELADDQVYVASVKIKDRVIDAASGTFGVRLELPNPDYAIPSGLHCRVRFLDP